MCIVTKLITKDSLSSEDISQFGEATKLTNDNASPPKDKQSLNSSNEGKEQDDSGVPQIALENPSPTRSLSPSFTTTALEMGPKTHISMRTEGCWCFFLGGLLLGRRSTITPRTSGYRNSYTPSVGSGDSSISSHSMTIGSVDEFQRNKHRRDTGNFLFNNCMTFGSSCTFIKCQARSSIRKFFSTTVLSWGSWGNH